MEDILSKYRDSHHEFTVEGGDLNANDPFALFGAWFEEAAENEREANAFTLTTANKSLQSSARIVYLKEVFEKEFVFYTNYDSHKGRDIAENPKVSMLFFWPQLSRQVRVEGICTKVPAEVSDEYFNSRPRGSQVGAWASHQSEGLESREELENRVKEYEEKFTDEVPRPPHWGGYKINPTLIEFWQGRPSRLHDRLVFTKVDSDWKIGRLNP